MQDLLDGYNLSYSYSCQYTNETGDSIDCNDIIVDET